MLKPKVGKIKGGLVLASAFFVAALYSSFNRPIWTDEWVHFSWAVFPASESTRRLVHQIVTGDADHHDSSAWLYSLWTVWSQEIFGANLFALRGLSFASGFLILFMAAWFIKIKGFDFLWQLMVVLALGAQSVLMYFAGEARPYMFLAMSTLAVLVFYSLSEKTRTFRLYWPFAFVLSLLGILNHAYFIGYVIGIALYSVLLTLWVNQSRFSAREVLLVLRPAFLVPLIGFAIILRGRTAIFYRSDLSSQEFDPFEFMRPNGGFLPVWLDTHIQFLLVPQRLAPLLGFVLVAAMVSITFLRFRRIHSQIPAWVFRVGPPLMLCFLAFLLSGFISLASLFNDYWILPRQWVSSLALAPVAIIWLLATLSDIAASRNEALKVSLVALSLVVVIIPFSIRATGQIGELKTYYDDRNKILISFPYVNRENAQAVRETIGDETLSNINLYRGGQVWPVCGYYGCPEPPGTR